MKSKGRQALQETLAWGEREKAKVLEMLTLLSPDMPEYDHLLDRLDKLELTLQQLRSKLG